MIKNNQYPMEEVIPIVSELAWRYTGCNHSSVTYERAQMLMEAVLYCINEYEKQEDNALLVKNVPAREAYERGQAIVMDKIKKLQELYNQFIVDFKDYGSVCLRDTVKHGIPVFLENYDCKYAPQETLLTLDYPILREDTVLSGISKVFCYVQCVCLEQKFLKKMDDLYIMETLRRYHRDYEHLFENICEIVLQNMIERIMLDKPLQDTGVTKDDLEEALEQLVAKYYDNDTDMLEYLKCGLPNMVTRWRK